MEEINYYRTDYLALCPYLVIHELVYVGTEIDDDGKVIFIFKDPMNIGLELAMGFEKSRENQYKRYWSFFRNEVDEAKRKVKNHEKLMK